MAAPFDKPLRVAVRFKDQNGSDVVNVWHFVVDGTNYDEGDLMDAIDGYLTSVYTEFDSSLCEDAVTYDMKVDSVDFIDDKWETIWNVGQSTWGSGLNMNNSTDPLPAGAALLAFLYTNVGKHLGKKFFGLFCEDANSEGHTVAGARTHVLSGLTKLLTPYVVDGSTNLIASLLGSDGVIRAIEDVGVAIEWAYQRRRRKGTGS
jgi:hypothetical protein